MEELKKEFEEKFKNALYIFETCDECGGNGMDMEDSYKTCGECHGAGKTKRMNPELLLVVVFDIAYPIVNILVKKSSSDITFSKKSFVIRGSSITSPTPI